MKVGIGWNFIMIGSMLGFCEYGDEPLAYLKVVNILSRGVYKF